MIKFIATDMDGTLLNSNHEIHESFPQTFEKLKQKDIIFAIASGRQYYTLLEQFKDIKDDVMFIAENGTFVVHKGEEIMVNAMNRELAQELIETARQIKDVHIILCGKKAAYVESSDEALLEEVNRYYKSHQIVASLDEVEDEVLKVTLCDFAGAEAHSYPHVKPFEDRVQIAVAGSIWVDMMAKGINKGEAINKIKDLYEIEHEKTAAFGDYLNDYEMMQAVHHSFAMANAHDDLKAISREVIKSNDENGVLVKIEELLAQMDQ